MNEENDCQHRPGWVVSNGTTAWCEECGDEVPMKEDFDEDY